MTAHDEIRQIDNTIRYLNLRKNQLNFQLSKEQQTETLMELAQHTAEVFQLGKTLLKGGSRNRKVTNARAVFCYISKCLGHTTVATAKTINRHHTTVIYYQNHGFAERYRDYTEFRKCFDTLLEKYHLEKPDAHH